jgi:hypothetical protein
MTHRPRRHGRATQVAVSLSEAAQRIERVARELNDSSASDGREGQFGYVERCG